MAGPVNGVPWTRRLRLWAAGIVAAWGAQAALLAWGRSTWFDEGNYAYKGWLFLTGAARPHLDIRTEYPLGSFFLAGLPHVLFGPDVALYAARLWSAAFLGGAGLLVYLAGSRLAGRAAGLLAATFLLLNPWSHLWAAGPYAPGNFFLAATALGLVLEREHRIRGRLLATGALVGCVFLRANYAPAAFLVGAYLLIRGRRVGEHLAVLVPAVLGMLAFLASAGFSPDRALSLLGVATGTEAGVRTAVRYEALRQVPSEIALIRTYVLDSGGMVLALLALLGVAILDRAGRARLGRVLRERRPALFLVLAYLAIVGFQASAFWLAVRKYWPFYACYFAPWLAVGLGAVIASAWPAEWPRGARRVLAVCLLAAFVVPAVAGRRALPLREPDLVVVRRVGAAIREVSAPDDRVWCCGEPYFMVAARRTGPSALSNGEHAYAPVADEIATKWHRWNRDQALRWLEDADVVVWSVRARDVLSRHAVFGDLAKEIELRLDRDFRLAREIDPGVPMQFRTWKKGPDGRGRSFGWVRIYERKRPGS